MIYIGRLIMVRRFRCIVFFNGVAPPHDALLSFCSERK